MKFNYERRVYFAIAVTSVNAFFGQELGAHFREVKWVVFSRVHATLLFTMSVGRSVGRSVCRSVITLHFIVFFILLYDYRYRALLRLPNRTRLFSGVSGLVTD